MAENNVIILGDEVEEAQGTPTQRGRGGMRWTSVMSGFILRRMCQLISSGVRTDKGFKEVHLNQVAKAVSEFTGNQVTGTQVYNHLRKWRQRWVKVSKLKELSGANWDDDVYMISLEGEHYMGHIQVCVGVVYFLLPSLFIYKN
jgi:methionine salvage enolase-phosphatase E1